MRNFTCHINSSHLLFAYGVVHNSSSRFSAQAIRHLLRFVMVTDLPAPKSISNCNCILICDLAWKV